MSATARRARYESGPDESGDFSCSCQVRHAIATGSIANTATVDSAEVDPTPANASSTATTAILVGSTIPTLGAGTHEILRRPVSPNTHR
jgi:hypothetical protein